MEYVTRPPLTAGPSKRSEAPKAHHYHTGDKHVLHLIRDPRDVGNIGHHLQQGIIYNDWIQKGSTDVGGFKLNAGVVTILHPGSYYIYAQVGLIWVS